MNTSWVKPGLCGVVIGAVATAAIGFSVGGWVTGGTAEKLANARADDAVIGVMTPVCVDRFQHDADAASYLATLTTLEPYKQADFIREKGPWATFTGYKFADTYRGFALYRGCLEGIIKAEKAVTH